MRVINKGIYGLLVKLAGGLVVTIAVAGVFIWQYEDSENALPPSAPVAAETDTTPDAQTRLTPPKAAVSAKTEIPTPKLPEPAKLKTEPTVTASEQPRPDWTTAHYRPHRNSTRLIRPAPKQILR